MCSSPISFNANCAEWKGTQYAQWIAVAAPNATKALSRAESAVSLSTQLRVLLYCSNTGSGISLKKSGTRPKFCANLSRICCLLAIISHLLFGCEVQLARDLYGRLDGPGHRAAILVHFDHTRYGLPILLLSAEMQCLLDPL